MKEYKIIIYSKKKILIQLLYTYIREYVEKKNKEGECRKSVVIESRSSMEMMKAELYRENYILLFDFGSKDEIADFKKMINRGIGNDEGINSYENMENRESDSKNTDSCGNRSSDKDLKDFRKRSSSKEAAHIILLDNIYNIEEKDFFKGYEKLHLTNDSKELIEIIEGIICTEDNLIKSSDNLTRREKEILILITKGKLNKEIANELNITERTVKNHIANLFKKINVYDRTQAAVYAIRNGIYNLYLEEL